MAIKKAKEAPLFRSPGDCTWEEMPPRMKEITRRDMEMSRLSLMLDRKKEARGFRFFDRTLGPHNAWAMGWLALSNIGVMLEYQHYGTWHLAYLLIGYACMTLLITCILHRL